MNEAQYTQKLLRELRGRLGSRGVVLKHADLFTAGIPDFSITVNGITTWFEAKRFEKNRIANTEYGNRIFLGHEQDDVDAIQWETLRRLGRGFIIVYTPIGCGIHLVTESWKNMKISIPLYHWETLVDTILSISMEKNYR